MDLTKTIKQDYHTACFKNFIKLFDGTIDFNHSRMDTEDDPNIILRLQGQNQLLKKFIRDLTTERELKYK